jgi:hypothetical protein
MTRKREEQRDGAAAQHHDGVGQRAGSSDSQIDGDEVYRMAAFRIRETANRIATLANSARDDALRHALLATCDRLLAEERDLLARTHG